MSATFKLHIKTRDYQEWVWLNEQQYAAPSLKPLESRLFHNDTIDLEGNLIIQSPYRTKEDICGILIVDGKTYGRYKDKLLYKCIPDAQHLPWFYIPYEEKNNTFSKLKVNKYITFKFKEWYDKHQHPIGLITNTIGNVDSNEAYTSYQLICHELNSSIKQLNIDTIRALREKPQAAMPLNYKDNYTIEDRRAYPIISIDPEGCTDIDDAIGLHKTTNGETLISIYIANVPLMLEYLNLWSSLSDRISTIYLGDNKIPMLPMSLSENRFSLLQGEDRCVFVIDVHIDVFRKQIMKYSYHTALIKVEKNYAYEARELLVRPDYQEMLYLIRYFNQSLKYVDKVRDSHDLIEFCMILMNYECSKILLKKGRGIFRSASKKETNCAGDGAGAGDGDGDGSGASNNDIPSEIKHIVENVAGEYCSADAIKPHELIAGGLPSYLHITSPIRRLVDCLNMLEIQRGTYINSEEASKFLEKWLDQIAVINKKTKAIRRLQNDAELLRLYDRAHNQMYNGIVFAQTSVAAENNLYKYKVYIPYIKLLSSVYTTKVIKNYSLMDFTVHLFLDENKMCKKVRLHML